jgi:hypothetical protein
VTGSRPSWGVRNQIVTKNDGQMRHRKKAKYGRAPVVREEHLEPFAKSKHDSPFPTICHNGKTRGMMDLSPASSPYVGVPGATNLSSWQWVMQVPNRFLGPQHIPLNTMT